MRAGQVISARARHGAELPGDPRAILTSIGLVVYDWDLASDRLNWGANAPEVFGLPDLAAWSSGGDFASLVDTAEGGQSRAEAVAASLGPDDGSGIAFSATYILRPRADLELSIEDTGRWYAGQDGRPAFVHGAMRVRSAAEVAGGVGAAGARERAAFLAAVAREIGHAIRGKQPITVFAIALENAEAVNEDHGFETGDAVIRTVVDRMRSVMRRRDRFAQYGGNRFALALRNCPVDQVRIAAERLRRAVSAEPIATERATVSARILVGAATAPDHAAAATGLLGRAERSLAAAKRGLGGGIVLYDPARAREGAAAAQPDTALDIVSLLNSRRIVLARQPVVDARTREPSFHEGLLRVRGETGALLAAGHVVPGAEASGLVPLVDARILELAADWLLSTPEARLSVNVSPQTLASPDWLATFSAHLGSRPGVASRLIVEVTETAAISDPDQTRRKLDAMKALGVAIAIDDFGSGHTSFRHLRNFPVDIVKIDGAFVQNLSRSPRDGFFVQALVDLAHHLGIATVAEWVENEETAGLLASWGVDLLQGNHCGRPQIDAEVETPMRAAG
ncbi:MAG: bifunctional diguanylate cyclase/phosphodiesterase [Methylobacteriaceae bacterium]|nr:bifunctional diguanylate cyclase/phosphodiesterase [Methylobacteriaceae bacterium]